MCLWIIQMFYCFVFCMHFLFADLHIHLFINQLIYSLDVVMFSFYFKPTVPFWSWDLGSWQKLLCIHSVQWDLVLTPHLHRCFLRCKIGLWQVCVLHYFNWPNVMFQMWWHTRIGHYFFLWSFVFLNLVLYCNHWLNIFILRGHMHHRVKLVSLKVLFWSRMKSTRWN